MMRMRMMIFATGLAVAVPLALTPAAFAKKLKAHTQTQQQTEEQTQTSLPDPLGLLRLLAPHPVTGGNGDYDALVSRHAMANGVPEALVRRVIHRESRGNARAVSKGNYGLMQIRLGTARAMGYSGDAQGLLDADTNMTYAVKYLAGAYKVAGGNHDRAVALYARGYYYEAKRQGLETPSFNAPSLNVLAKAGPADAAETTPVGAAGTVVNKP